MLRAQAPKSKKEKADSDSLYRKQQLEQWKQEQAAKKSAAKQESAARRKAGWALTSAVSRTNV